MSDKNAIRFSDLGKRKAELKLEMVRKETEIRIGFESFVSSLDPVKILERLWTDVSTRLDAVARIATMVFSYFQGGRKRKRKPAK